MDACCAYGATPARLTSPGIHGHSASSCISTPSFAVPATAVGTCAAYGVSSFTADTISDVLRPSRLGYRQERKQPIANLACGYWNTSDESFSDPEWMNVYSHLKPVRFVKAEATWLVVARK